MLRALYPNAECYSDIRSGLRFDRKGFTKLLEAVQQRRKTKVIVTYSDRLARFGFDLLETIFAAYGTTIEVINDNNKLSLQEELVKDLITIITSFSGSLYSMRSHKAKKIVETVKSEI